ncbi:MAG TPA: cupin domain-containing protein [Sedimentisphaerales bacterium]|nr:cupin domain-containing protein [Sedimentisphaerales bacterium]
MKLEKSSDVAKKPVMAEGAKDVEIRWLICKEDGADHIAMRMFEVQPGGHTPLHAHPHEHEVFIVEGKGIFVCEGKEYEFGRECVVFVPGDAEHQFRNTGDSVLRFLCIIPGWAA